LEFGPVFKLPSAKEREIAKEIDVSIKLPKEEQGVRGRSKNREHT